MLEVREHEHLLIIDDEPFVRDALKRVLESEAVTSTPPRRGHGAHPGAASLRIW